MRSSEAEESTAYPTLSDAQLTLLRSYGTARELSVGEVVYSPADEHNDLVVVLAGEIEVHDESQEPAAVLGGFGPGTFVGELNLLTGQRPFVTARVTRAGAAATIPIGRLRDLLARETELADLLVKAMIARRRLRLADERSPIVVVGSATSEGTLALRTFLNRNSMPYRFLDADVDADVPATVTADDLPAVIVPDRVLRRATPAVLAEALGLDGGSDDDGPYDVAVVGAGPAGLAAAVYGASEGLRVVVFDAIAPGGQAGTSSRIENYLGFPDGISGTELTSRAAIQALRFGAALRTPCRITGIESADGTFAVTLTDGSRTVVRAVVVAVGAEYRRLPLDGWDRFEGSGIYFAATELEAGLCAGAEVVVLGGGNSAGQAALYLARRCSRVTVVIRRESLEESMSRYLIDRIDADDRIVVAANTEISAVRGNDHLTSVELRDKRTGQIHEAKVRALFCFIGARPGTAWLPGEIQRDEDGFVLTDVELPASGERHRFPYETSADGVFAAGDVRRGSMKRVAAAVGEGSSVIRSVHQYLGLTVSTRQA
ncbi:FAD-dependent oxidoreductase [Paractinoplanes lichenicola]|uniref:FAD-dependent oxidoreductase n=1 Tax=Paractinoplanes lichenicola TaxID=2802976 RepID=A0ABS1VWQ2_9ACTN|nr:FAD-dependent oxidoreductase [Actinoplanes lichenicola]MBL7258919.1 FAD-dependent oxidoreductase [Actinoplanes lichenicola]